MCSLRARKLAAISRKAALCDASRKGRSCGNDAIGRRGIGHMVLPRSIPHTITSSPDIPA
jgi:hypothetical protein